MAQGYFQSRPLDHLSHFIEMLADTSGFPVVVLIMIFNNIYITNI